MAPARKGWGSLARKGAASMRHDGPRRSSQAEADRRERPRPHDSEKWQFEEKVARSSRGRQTSAQRPVKEKTAKAASAVDRPEPIILSPEAVREIEERAGKRAERLVRYLRDAARAYASERWGDARKALRPLLAEVPDAPSIQELNGMLFYRTGKWAAAVKELEASHAQTMSFDLYPAIMDCRRAQKQWAKVEEFWTELKEISPDPEVMAEGRIVYASSLAEQGLLEEGIRVLEKVPRPRREPKMHHLRSWYVLADFYETAGDVAMARIWFDRIMTYEPDMADVAHRLELLD
jgi:hypothetical protein